MIKPSVTNRFESRIPERFRWPMRIVLWLAGVVLAVLLLMYLEGCEQAIIEFFGNENIYYGGMDFLVAVLAIFFLITGFLLFLPAFLLIWAVILSMFKRKRM